MKILAINASPRQNGATAQALSVLASELQAQFPVSTRMVHLSLLPMQFCKGCLACYYSGKCVITNDGLEELSQEIAASDAVIFATPTYVTGVSAQMKTLMDRGHISLEQLLHKKPCLTLATQKNAGGRTALQTLNAMILYSGGHLASSVLITTEFLKPGGSLTEKNLKKLKTHAARLGAMISKKRAPSLAGRLIHAIAFRFFIRPLVKRENYTGIMKHWQNAGIQ